MPRKKRTEKNISKSAAPALKPVLNPAFEALAALKQSLAVKAAEKKPKAPAPSSPPLPSPPPANDQAVFMMEMADVVPLAGQDKKYLKSSPPAKAWKTPELPNEDLEALRTLSALVSGKAEFDLIYTDEYVEGQTRGLPPALMEQLRAGHIPYQDHLDLHGYTLTQAEAAVTRFILDSVALGRNCVLLIHGRGHGSKDGVPVLKRYLETFLLRGILRKYLLAFTTAQPVDGGLGASYILLRG